jgi:hypothetical protein
MCGVAQRGKMRSLQLEVLKTSTDDLSECSRIELSERAFESLLPSWRGLENPFLKLDASRKDDGGGSGDVHSVSSTDASADAAIDHAPEVDVALDRRSRLRHDCC